MEMTQTEKEIYEAFINDGFDEDDALIAIENKEYILTQYETPNSIKIQSGFVQFALRY